MYLYVYVCFYARVCGPPLSVATGLLESAFPRQIST